MATAQPARTPVPRRAPGIGVAPLLLFVAVAIVGTLSAVATPSFLGRATAVTPNFAARDDAICARTNMQIEAIPKPNSQRSNETAFAAADRLSEAEIAKLKRLTPPSDEKATYDKALVYGLGNALAGLEAIADENDGHSNKAGTLVADAILLGRAENAEFRKLGLTQCAKSVQPEG